MGESKFNKESKPVKVEDTYKISEIDILKLTNVQLKAEKLQIQQNQINTAGRALQLEEKRLIDSLFSDWKVEWNATDFEIVLDEGIIRRKVKAEVKTETK